LSEIKLLDAFRQLVNDYPDKVSYRSSGTECLSLKVLTSVGDQYFIKVGQSDLGNKMIFAEHQGLRHLDSHGLRIPRLYDLGKSDGNNFIVLAYVDETDTSKESDLDIAEQLASIHKVTHSSFGLEDNNFIGRLSQSNRPHNDFISFYQQERLLPQIEMAKAYGFLKGIDPDRYLKSLESILPLCRASLIHGDLWNGNLLASEKKVYFIDPSVAFSCRELDISMMQLFGGFSSRVYSFYNEIFPLESDWELRVPHFQLYYLLVHLNMFGASYEGAVRRVMNSFN